MNIFLLKKGKRRQAFTLIELIVVIAIIGLLAAILTPQIGNIVDKSKAVATLAVYKVIESACINHYNDTGNYAQEWNVYYAGAGYHNLSESYYAGWNGPYLKPFGYGINPTKGWPAISNSLGTWNADSGFDLNRDGTAEKTGAGNFLHFENFSVRIAQIVDNNLDGSGGTSGSWNTNGGVEWRSAWGGTIQIYLTGG
ncbi:MAG: hypothetical protein A3J51_00420 [Omnitrophica WOR_2 bacterium RIFCSPHIGHO2_02_FULL_45_21]|nr:MAG: hypothetical protein A3J51_00420 [Omnitrophica WOR_2 bacterium RIFCSPHIGHO2_02_FULL_45_21]